jgi:riboflavin synthase
MFTGIVQAIGTVRAIRRSGSDLRLEVAADGAAFADAAAGESICVNGVCLTVAATRAGVFHADVSAATLSCTTLGSLREGSPVNLERSLRASDRLGGHLVSGHVDAVGRIESVENAGASLRLEVEAPAALSRYLCPKGSICMDGVSLTVNETAGECFTVNIIPHTREQTIASGYGPGTAVNLEADLIARYLEVLIRTRT